MLDLITKIKEANLRGRGGAGFPTGQKWEMVKNATGEQKYVIANGSEGEPGVLKDSYILDRWPKKVVHGVFFAMEAVGAETGYLYLRADLYKKHRGKLEEIIQKTVGTDSGQARMTIHVFREDGKYLNGEETTLLNSIEKRRSEPRYKPPFPTTCGLWSCPTLINNIETFYRVAQIADESYQNMRFYSLTGTITHPGVYELPVDLTLEEVLRQTNNYPQKVFFVQAGGGACGPVYTREECKQQILTGAGALVVHDFQEDPVKILQKWTDFFVSRNCGQCIPCREGFYRINQLIQKEKIDYKLLKEILRVMADASFCGLGQYAPEGYLNFIEKILKR